MIDSTQYVIDHRSIVNSVIRKIVRELIIRGRHHDLTKLIVSKEKDTFDALYTLKMSGDHPKFGSPEYDEILSKFQDGIELHYVNNSHHPEHHSNGISGMTLVDLVEMFCDWAAVNIKNGSDIDLDIARTRFGMSDQLCDIFQNTWRIINRER